MSYFGLDGKGKCAYFCRTKRVLYHNFKFNLSFIIFIIIIPFHFFLFVSTFQLSSLAGSLPFPEYNYQHLLTYFDLDWNWNYWNSFEIIKVEDWSWVWFGMQVKVICVRVCWSIFSQINGFQLTQSIFSVFYYHSHALKFGFQLTQVFSAYFIVTHMLSMKLLRGHPLRTS